MRLAFDFAGKKREAKVVHICVLFGIIGKSTNDGKLIHRKLYVQARIGHSEIVFELRDGFGDCGAGGFARHDFDGFHSLTRRKPLKYSDGAVVDRLEVAAIVKVRDARSQL
jgi:hypothetical protein